MSNIDITNSFFSHYASAATDNVAAYQGMHQYLNDNVTFSDMAYNNGIKGKKVFAMWHWFCTKDPAPVKVTFDPSKTREQGGIVIPVYQAKYDFKRGWTMLFKNLSLVIRASTSNLYFMSHKIMPICICFALALLLFGCATPTPDTEDFSPNFLPVNNTSNPKNIFVFMDGTSNNSKVPTNIYRLFQEIKKNNDNRTVARYIEGVGNAEDPLDSTLGIAGSFGMEDRILQGYEFITQHYKPKSENYPGDRIYIFGFSRGAHTARSLAGLISYAGVPKVSDAELNNKDDLIDIGNDILELTKDELDSEHANDWEKWQPGDKPILTELIRENKIIHKKGREVQPAEVEFLGVWDTVPGSLFKDKLFGTYPDLACKESIGFIKSTWGFKHIAHLFGVSYGERYKIDSYPAIHHIAHAVAKDEKRSMFRPLFICSKALNTNEALPQTNESWLVLTGVGRAPLVPVW
ncbi:MAG: DUF2235 domain-containing protein [Methylococcales bacterium]|nr:DUF2235 domain-containing protein [Methylococcales bacterium]